LHIRETVTITDSLFIDCTYNHLVGSVAPNPTVTFSRCIFDRDPGTGTSVNVVTVGLITVPNGQKTMFPFGQCRPTYSFAPTSNLTETAAARSPGLDGTEQLRESDAIAGTAAEKGTAEVSPSNSARSGAVAASETVAASSYFESDAAFDATNGLHDTRSVQATAEWSESVRVASEVARQSKRFLLSAVYESALLESDAAFGASDGLNDTFDFDATASYRDSLPIGRSALVLTRPFILTAVPALSAVFPPSLALALSVDSILPQSGIFTLSMTPTPLPSPEKDHSYTVSFIRSFTQSLSLFEATTISWTYAVTLTVTQSSETAHVLEYETRSAIAVPTFVFSMVRLPVYIRTVVTVRVGFIFTPTDEAPTQISTGLLIGVVAGGAVLLALILGLIVFIVRSPREASFAQEQSGEEPNTQLNESSTESAPEVEVVEEEPRSRMASVRKDHSSGSGSWSSIGDFENEDAGLYV
jgi:hypothetical protein